MTNNFSCFLTQKGRWLTATLFLLFSLGIGQMWATDITVTPPTPNNASNPFSTGLYVMSVSGTGSKLSSGAITTSTNGAVITINFQATKSDMYIKTITFNSLGNGTLSSDDGTFDGQVFTATGNKNSVNVVLTSNSSKKGTVKVTNVVVNTGTNVVETITFTGVDSGDGQKATFTSSAATSALSSITTDASAFSVSSGKLSWTNGKKVILTAESNIKYVAFSIADGKMYDSFSAAETTYNSANYSWSGSSKTVTLTNGSGGGREIKGLYVIIDPVVKHHVTYSLGGDYGTTPTQADVAVGAKFTLHNGTTGITAPNGKQFAGWNDGSSTYAGGAEYTMGTSDVTLTAVWENAKTDPTATFSAGAYVVGESALDLSTLWSSNSDGAVTYALKVASDDATVSGTSFSATKAGSYAVTASQAATATYNAIEKEATITVTVNPLGTHTLTWTMKVGGSSSTSSLVNGVNSTSTYVTISNTPNIGSSSSVESATPKSDRTVKVLGDNIGTERGENSYIEFPFSIADGYIFTPTSASVKVANVDNTRSYDVVIMNADGSESAETTFASTKTDGSVETISWNSISGLTLEGNCKMRIYAYLASGTATHRFGTPITITGTVAAVAPASGWSLHGSFDTWGDGYAMSEAGTNIVRVERTLDANTHYQFKIVNGTDWYGDGETFGGTKTQEVSATGTSNNCHLVTSEQGTYRFEYNTESHALTITYPHSYTYYYSNTDSWEHVYVYKFSYNEVTGENAAWPGVEITTPTALCGDYYAAASDGYAKLIFNNGLSGDDEKKTGDMVVAPDDEGKYVAGTGNAWTAMSTYTISFAGNGNTSGEMSDISGICPNTDRALTANAFAKTGYNFAGWVADVDVTVGDATITAGNLIANEATLKNITSNIALTAQWTIDCPTEGTVYSASSSATSDITIATNTENLELNSSTHKTTVSGGKMYVYNGQPSGTQNLITSTGFCMTNGPTYFHIQLDCPLEAGDIISVKVGKNSNERGVWISSTRTNTVPAAAPACALTTTGTGSALKAVTYTVTGSDEYHGKTDFYIYRATSNSTYFNDITITRPEKFDVTYWKNDGSETKTEAEGSVVADNEFTRSGYRFIEWNTQADGNGSKVNVGAAVTADIELFAIWAQEYTVSYANTGAASGDAPTNENKYIAGETFKVAGVGTMVAPTDHAFGGWNDGSTTYQEDDDYTVGTGNVSFAPVWNETFNVYYYPNGGGGTAYTAPNVTTVNECFFAPAAGKLFDKWTTHEDGTGDVYAPGAAVTTSINLYAQWKDDECTARQSLIAVTFTGETAATAVVNGYNEKEYASAALINKLGDSNPPVNGGYKIYGDGGYIFATIAKGDFQEGDKLEVEVTQVPASQKLDVYAYGDDIATAYKVVSIEQVSAAGTYSYALTAANATAINALGYKSLGIYRATGSNMNAYVKSLSIKGCRSWVIKHDVTFNLNGQTGSAPAAQSIEEGGLVTKPADPVVDGQFFRGWFTDEECTAGNEWDFANDAVGTEDVVLYAKWEADPCDSRRSIVKAVMASTTTATVTGHNENEYAGGYLLNGLGTGSNQNTYDFGDGVVTGYKLTGDKSAIMATLAKGGFAEGDKVIIAVTKEADGGKLPIYVAKDKDNAVSIVNLDVTAPGIYTYTLTAANIATIEAAGEGYMSIGAYRGTYNPFIYSVELTGCRNWSVYHTLTFKNIDGSATIAAPALAEGAYASTVAPAAPRIKGKRFLGWSESVDGALVTITSYTITTDMILYAVYEDVECPTSGTVYKFQFKTGLDDETLGVSDNKDMSEYVNASGDGYLTYTSSANNYAAITTDSLIQMKNIAACLKVDLDCALAAGDRIRVRCYNNPIRVQVGTTYEASKDLEFAKNDFGWQDVTASMVGKSDLYITRASNGNANLAYVEIYRRPALTGIEMADMTLRINQALAPQVTLLPEGALVTSQAWAITAREGASDAEISSTTGVISAGSETGTLTVQATYNGDKVATCTVTIINVYESLVPVTGTTNWNWAGAASSETKINDVANRGVILANYINGANFEKLEGIAGEYEYAYRNNSYPGFQGTQLHFVTTVPGMLTITARNSGSGQRVYVNNREVTTSDLTSTPTDYMIAVPAGDVTITSSTGQNMRIYAMKFDTNLAAYELTDNVLNGYTRTVAAGQYGTICLATDGVMTGGILFEIAYYDSETRKIFFDEVLNGEMIADRPYVFLPEENSTQLKVFYTEEANTEVTAGHYNGLWGTYDDLNSSNTTGSPLWHNYIISNNMYIRVTGSNCTLRKNRAYIKFGAGEVPESPTAPLPGRRRISLGTNSTEVATDIDNVQGDNVQCTKVMIDGQLYILRGEKMYDATGRMVK